MPRSAIFGTRQRAPAAAIAVIAVIAVSAALAASTTARAQDSLLYVGGSLGQGNSKVGQINFNKTDLGWKAIVGTRPVHWFGAELADIDFGKPKDTYALAQSSA